MDNHAPALVLAKVLEFDDPNANGTIRLQRPDKPVGDGFEARMLFAHAGEGGGFVALPGEGDMAVVAFKGTQAYVLGFIHAGSTTTVLDDPKQRRFQSRNGHKITLDDGDADGILLEDAHGNKIEMTSEGIKITSDGEITIEASGAAKVKGSTVELN